MRLLRPTGFTHISPGRRAPAARYVGVACVVGILSGLALRAVAAGPVPATSRPASDAAEPMWVNHVEPILNKSCFKCHGGSKQKGGLDLRRPQAIFAGGTDGSVVIPGRPAESPLYQRLQAGVEGHMPPDKEPQLSTEEIAFVQQWIATLPDPNDRRPAPGTGRDWNQNAPSLVEMAARDKWQPPAGVEGSEAIDHLIQSRWREQQISGSGPCDDRTFVRRLYLDLAGRIPTRGEVDSFVDTAGPQKRAALVDQLLAGDEYPRHMAEVLDVVLMERKGKAAEAGRKSHGWNEYLRAAVASNRPWNDVVADLITARPPPERAGAAWFLYERKNNYQAMAEAVAPVAFGVSVACAQCHNHPLAHEIKQQQYWGLVAAFNRTTNVDGGDRPALSESAVGGFVNFTNLKKESQPAVLVFPNDRTIPEERPADGAKEQDSDANYLVPPPKDKGKSRQAAVPKFSRRGALADAATRDNPLLARAFVNRTWAMLLGRGFVNPVDQMDSRHPPSHPELLAWLAGDFEKSGYDVKHLIRTIVLSRTYQLDSRRTDSAPPPAPELFARGPEKPLSAEVLHRSLLVATGRDPANTKEAGDTEALRQALVVAFPSLFDAEYNPTLQQTMFLTNSPLFDALLRPGGGNLTARLLELPANEDRVKAAFAEILGRLPDNAELAGGAAYLAARSDRPEAGVRQLAWALLTGTEFLLNH